MIVVRAFPLVNSWNEIDHVVVLDNVLDMFG